MGNLFKYEKGTRVLNRIPLKHECRATEITKVLPSGCWEGKTCCIIGGGPSLQNFNWNLLKTVKTIGINKAFIKYPVDVNYAMDYNFFDFLEYDKSLENSDIRESWRTYSGIKLFAIHDSKSTFKKGIYYVHQLNKKGISFNLKSGIYLGDNSGTGALMLAVALGCKKIGLLGYDFRVNENRTHWHEGYSYQDIECLKNSLVEFRKNVEEFASGILELGIEVYNLSTNSELKSFPFLDLNTFFEYN